MPDDVQPAEGQGAEATTGLFDSYLNNVPEDGREIVSQYLKDAEKNVNSRLEEAATLKQKWEPYSQIQGLPGPEQLSELVQWSSQTLSSQESFDTWVRQVAEEKGFTQAEAEEAIEDGLEEGLSPAEIQQQIDERAQAAVSPFEDRLNAIETERGVEHETQAIQNAFSTIEKAEKTDLSEEQREIILALGMDHAVDSQGNELPVGNTSWVDQGFARFRAIGAQAQKAFVEEKTAQPISALSTGGMPSQKPILDFKEAGLALRERLVADRTN